MSLADLARSHVSPLWVWLTERIWSLEHAFEHAKAQRKEQDTTYRIFFVLALFAAGFLTLSAVAVNRALFSDAGPDAGVAPQAVSARADLVDRNGRLLAVDLTHYGAYLDPRDVWDPAETRKALLGLAPEVRERLDRAFASGRRSYLAGGLTPERKQQLHDLGLPGLEFEEEDRRVYPLGDTAAHLIGFTDTGGKGLAGAERGLDKALLQAGTDGAPVALSIDLRVQAALDDEIRRAGQYFQTVGAVGIVVDVHTGEILGMSSYPSYDPNEPGKSPPANMVDHVAQTVYEPGSVFKVFTIAMGLDSGLAEPHTLFDARAPLQLPGGRIIHDYDHDNAMLPLWEVFTHSSNIGTARLALGAGPERMERYYSSLGLFAAAPSELAESARPIKPRRFDVNTTASVSFGQAISVTPLSLATAMTSVVNGGVYRPLTIRKVDGAPQPGRRVLSEKTSRTMLELMRLNTLKASGGTGGKADAEAPGLRIGGKTGSAQKAENGRYGKMLVSSFASVFPTDGPLSARRYFVLVMMDSPHATKETYGFATGGWTAAPTAGRIVDRIAPFLGVARQPQSAVDAHDAQLITRYIGAQALKPGDGRAGGDD